jgi:V8-like Glu-specific endopeptidase
VILKFIIFSFLFIFHFHFGASAAHDPDLVSKGVRTHLSKERSPGVEIDDVTGLSFLGDRSQSQISHGDLRRRNLPFKRHEHFTSFRTKKYERQRPSREDLLGKGAVKGRASPSMGKPVHLMEDLKGTPLGFLGGIKKGDLSQRAVHEREELRAPPDVGSRRVAQGHLLEEGKTHLIPESYVVSAAHKIIGHEDIGSPPYASVVKLEMVLLGEEDVVLRTYLGSGVLIGGKYVLTAAHNLFFRQYETGPSAIHVFPGRSGDHIPHETDAAQFIVHPSYVLKQDETYKEFDVGLIVLEDPIGDTAGWLPYVSLGPDMLLEKPLTVVGYPSMMHIEPEAEGAKPSFQMLQGHTMYEMLGKSTKLTERQIFYLINTYGGHSGSPILKRGPDGYAVCGIHTYGGDTEDGNCGTWISPDLHTLIGRWIEEFTEAPEEE